MNSSANLVEETAAFHNQFGDKVSPSVALQILDRQSQVSSKDLWLCFSVTYPQARRLISALNTQVQQLDSILYDYQTADFESNPWPILEARIKSWNWPSDIRGLARSNDPYELWLPKINKARDRIADCVDTLVASKAGLEGVGGPPKTVKTYLAILTEVEQCLVEGSELLAKHVGTRMLEHEAAETASTTSVADKDLLQPDPLVSIVPTKKWHSYLPFYSNARKRGQHNNLIPPPATHRNQRRTRWTRNQLRHLKTQATDFFGHMVTVYTLVILGFIISIILTAFAILKAQSSNGNSSKIPVIDSNFYSTVAQTDVGILSIFTILIPLLRRDRKTQPEIPVSWPTLFYMLLVVSFVTAVAASITYPWQAEASIIIAYVSTACQILATLLLIISTTNTITQNAETIEGLERKIRVG